MSVRLSTFSAVPFALLHHPAHRPSVGPPWDRAVDPPSRRFGMLHLDFWMISLSHTSWPFFVPPLRGRDVVLCFPPLSSQPDPGTGNVGVKIDGFQNYPFRTKDNTSMICC